MYESESLPFLFCVLSVSSSLGLTARRARAGAPVGQNSAPTQTNASADAKIEAQNWARPEPGWLYVLDPKPDAGGPGGRVWLVDPETAKVMGSIRTGENPDFALSPDGSRFYVASITEGDSSELAVIDTAQGAVLQRGTVEDREVANVITSCSAMAVSGDGLVLRILLDTPNRQTQIPSCSPPSRPRPASFCPGACTWGTAARPFHLLPNRGSVRFSLSENE
jgi:hypothetical protein